MKRIVSFFLLALAAVLLVSTVLGAVQAYDLSWWTADGGGDTSWGDTYRLVGTAGQPDAGLMQGGEYSLAGGFLGGVAVPTIPQEMIFLPLVLH